MKKATCMVLSFFFMFSVSACQTRSAEITYYDEAGNVLKTETVEADETPSFPEVHKEGYIFLGWFKSPESLERVDSRDGLSGEVSLYPRFESETTVDRYREYLDETNPVVTIEVKGYGQMKIELFPDVAPNTVRNMVHLVEEAYYDGSSFHRIIEDFMIQGGRGDSLDCAIEGEFASNGIENPLEHSRGVVSMARTVDMNSATGQFFIVHKPAHFLDGDYAAFGAMVEGFHVLDAIASVETTGSPNDAPLSDVTISNVSIDTKGVDYDPPVCYGG